VEYFSRRATTAFPEPRVICQTTHLDSFVPKAVFQGQSCIRHSAPTSALIYPVSGDRDNWTSVSSLLDFVDTVPLPEIVAVRY
jgi:hypothetical protein